MIILLFFFSKTKDDWVSYFKVS